MEKSREPPSDLATEGPNPQCDHILPLSWEDRSSRGRLRGTELEGIPVTEGMQLSEWLATGLPQPPAVPPHGHPLTPLPASPGTYTSLLGLGSSL